MLNWPGRLAGIAEFQNKKILLHHQIFDLVLAGVDRFHENTKTQENQNYPSEMMSLNCVASVSRITYKTDYGDTMAKFLILCGRNSNPNTK